MIKIEITAETAELARKEMLDLIGGDPTIALANEINKEAAETAAQITTQPEVKPKTRAPKEKAPVKEEPTAGDIAMLVERTTPITDPLATPASAADPLSNGASVVPDPLATTPVTRVVTAPLTSSTDKAITLQTIREKIGTLTNNKQAVKDLVATYKKADGTACEKPSDIQEKDYEVLYDELNTIK